VPTIVKSADVLEDVVNAFDESIVKSVDDTTHFVRRLDDPATYVLSHGTLAENLQAGARSRRRRGMRAGVRSAAKVWRRARRAVFVAEQGKPLAAPVTR
jgi:hypothetical protein